MHCSGIVLAMCCLLHLLINVSSTCWNTWRRGRWSLSTIRDQIAEIMRGYCKPRRVKMSHYPRLDRKLKFAFKIKASIVIIVHPNNAFIHRLLHAEYTNRCPLETISNAYSQTNSKELIQLLYMCFMYNSYISWNVCSQNATLA